MTVLITADLHFSANPRDAYRHAFMQEILPDIIAEHDVTKLIVLGDLCEAKDNHSSELVNQVVDHFYRLAGLCPVTILKGNHDYLTSPDNPFFRFLCRITGISWVNEPTAIGKWLFLPHTANYKRDWIQFKFSNYDVVFAHQTFQNAVSASGHQLDGVPVSIFPKSVKVISGDIHMPQEYGPITYVGAPYTVDFGDTYKPRMLLLDGRGIKSLPCPGPQKRLLELQNTSYLEEIDNLLEGDILKVRCQFDPGGEQSWTQIKDEIGQWANRRGFVLHAVQPVTVKSKSRRAAAAKTNRSDEELLTTYAKARQLNEGLLKTGLFLMRKA